MNSLITSPLLSGTCDQLNSPCLEETVARRIAQIVEAYSGEGGKAVFGLLLGPWMTTSCQQRSPCFDKLPNVSCVFAFSHAIFILFLANYIIHFVHFHCVFSTDKHNTTQHTHTAHNIHNAQPHTAYNTHNTQHITLYHITPYHILHLFGAHFGDHAVCFWPGRRGRDV